MVTAVRFSNGQEAFSLTTAAQNLHVFPRKSPLLKEHFFEWLKTANFSTACGTSTLKSPLSQTFSVPDVHPRLRKHLSRCTLDCGFKTPESPALRGFVAERCPITGTSLYLVLKSNGLRHLKNLPVKFGFTLKTVSANIAKKLPPQHCFKPLLIPIFNFSHNRLSEKDRTQRLTRQNRGLPSPGHNATLCCQRNCSVIPLDSAVLLYTYISRFSVDHHHQQQLHLRPSFIAFFSLSHKWPTFAFTGESGYTLAFRIKMAHNGSHGETRGVSDGGAITTLGAFHTFRKPCVAGYQNGKLCRFWVLVRCAPEGHREPSGQRCAYARRCSEGVAAPLGCVIFLLLSKW